MPLCGAAARNMLAHVSCTFNAPGVPLDSSLHSDTGHYAPSALELGASLIRIILFFNKSYKAHREVAVKAQLLEAYPSPLRQCVKLPSLRQREGSSIGRNGESCVDKRSRGTLVHGGLEVCASIPPVLNTFLTKTISISNCDFYTKSIS